MNTEKLRCRVVSSLAPRDGERYYEGWARRYRIAGSAITLVLVLFMLAALIFGFREFTYQNIYYFFKDLDTLMSSDRSAVSAIDYGSGEERSFAAFKGGIAVADKYSVSVYSAGGRRTAEFNVGYYTPRLRTSEKYLLIYEADGSAFTICNSFVRLYSETLPGTICAADISPAGEALIHTQTNEYAAVLYWYDSSFSQADIYSMNSLVTASAISADGKYLLATTLDSKGAEFASELRVFRRGEESGKTVFEASGEIIIGCYGLADGIYVLTDRGAYVMDVSGNVRAHSELAAGREYVSCDAGDKCMAAISRDKNGYQLMYLPLRGEGMTVKLDRMPISLKVSGKQVYVLFEGSVARYDFESGSVEFADCAPGAVDVVVTAARRLLVCYPSRATYSDISEVK